MVDEISIQSERSPIESGQHPSRPKEHGVFKLLLTGLDDSSIVAVEGKKVFSASKALKIEIIDGILQEIEDKLAIYPDIKDLQAQDIRLSLSLEKAQSEFDAVRVSVRALIEEKQKLSIEIPQIGQRIDEIQIHLERFAQLEKIYESDIERLRALEEAGFLISLEGKKACPLCGAEAESQKHIHDIENIDQTQKAALLEIVKIERLRKDLKATVIDLQNEIEKLRIKYPILSKRLTEVEQEIVRFAPKANQDKQTISEIISARDQTKMGLSLLEQRNSFIVKREEFRSLKAPSKDDKPNLKTPDSATYRLCKVISRVLKAWEFPGDCLVSFDFNNHDLMIDGKLRTNNGKGVRAVTHAAFKVALFIFCKENNLPHPGFVVLDTPLLTYRDPMRNPEASALSAEEKVIANSPLKERFFQHLSSIEHLGQFIILENIDPPEGIEKIAHVQTFSGSADSNRAGLFPLSQRL